ncbi:UNVERIFIED_CONTAM: hypothetical protein FKN15_029595 [Acipenser sinensis]
MAAVYSQALKLRVIVEADNIRKITLDTRPESVDDLKSILKDKLKLDVDFSLQYEDPDFDGELISLVDIDELPQKTTLKLFMAEVETSSISATDTELLSDVSSPERLSRWPPGIFPVPTFAYEDLASLEKQRLEILQEVQKTEKTLPLIDRMMQTTFALRWQEVVTNSPPVRDILERWPALRLESQVYAEFQQISNQNLLNIFYEERESHTLHLMTLYRQRASKTGKTSDALADILRIHDLQNQHDVHTRRTTLLHALPVLLRKDISEFFKTCRVEDSDEPDVGDAPVAILSVVSDDTEKPIHFNPNKISIVLESEVMKKRLETRFLRCYNDVGPSPTKDLWGIIAMSDPVRQWTAKG